MMGTKVRLSFYCCDEKILIILNLSVEASVIVANKKDGSFILEVSVLVKAITLQHLEICFPRSAIEQCYTLLGAISVLVERACCLALRLS